MSVAAAYYPIWKGLKNFMQVSLIGMSNTGKSWWSKKLEKKGFTRFCCDDLIEEKLGNELKKLGYSGIQDVSKWMGQPYDPQYMKNSQKYLDFEREVMDKILDGLEKVSRDQNIVIDTTGSVIYTGQNILARLSEYTKIVYLNTPESVQKEMYEQYIRGPKPVVWGNAYNKKETESELEALSRCYPELLKARADKYHSLAAVELDYFDLRKPGITVDDFIDSIQPVVK